MAGYRPHLLRSLYIPEGRGQDGARKDYRENQEEGSHEGRSGQEISVCCIDVEYIDSITRFSSKLNGKSQKSQKSRNKAPADAGHIAIPLS